MEKYKGKLVVDFKKETSRKIKPCDIILQLTKEVDCRTLLDSFNLLQYFTKYHPAGYSSEYLAGRKFASRIFGWNNTFTYNTENKALMSK